jgi:hypothetical protein
MSAHCLYETATGLAVSMASTDAELANPLPAHLTDRIITDQEFLDWRGGYITWDAATLSFVATGKLTPAEVAQREANKAQVEALIDGALSQLVTFMAFPDVATVPAGTMTTAQLSNNLRTVRDAVQQNRNGLRQLAQILKRTLRIVREDFSGTD